MIVHTMELKREQVEAFQKAYKQSLGEDLSYEEAFEVAHRLVHIFLILEKAQSQEVQEDELLDEHAIE